RKCLLRADHYQNLLSSGNAGVDQISLQHYIMIHQNRHDYDRIFRSLGFMNGCGISMHQFIKLSSIVLNASPIKIHQKGTVLHINGLDDTNISVEDFLVVIVLDLHDLIVWPINKSTPSKALSLWV